MGLRFGMSRDSYPGYTYARQAYEDRTKTIPVNANPCVTTGNPNPNNYQILASQQVGSHLVVKLKYHDCINYEGVKILLYNNWTIKDLIAQGAIDPHFSEHPKFKSPIGRFEPTEKGWAFAVSVAELVTDFY